MTGNRPSSDSDLLSLCAILRWFDDDLLRALAVDEDAIGVLLASERVVPVTEPVGAYQLHEDVRADALAQLRAARPSEELTLHRYVFDYFLERMRESALEDQDALNEDDVLYHLGELFLLIAARQEWHTLDKIV